MGHGRWVHVAVQLGWNVADGKPINVFESGAILLYLAEKTGKFLSHDPRLKWETIQWVFFQMGGVGPMFGQVLSFSKSF